MDTVKTNEAIQINIIELRGEAGFKPAALFVKKLRRRFPERNYADVFGPMDFRQQDFTDTTITRIAKVGKETVGILIGSSEGKEFYGDFIFTNPQYAKYRVGEKLIHSVFTSHDKFKLHAGPLSNAPGNSSKSQRVSALESYYLRMGFEFGPEDIMVWKKKI